MGQTILDLILQHGLLGAVSVLCILFAIRKDRDLSTLRTSCEKEKKDEREKREREMRDERERHEKELREAQERLVAKSEKFAEKNQEVMTAANAVIESMNRSSERHSRDSRDRGGDR